LGLSENLGRDPFSCFIAPPTPPPKCASMNCTYVSCKTRPDFVTKFKISVLLKVSLLGHSTIF
jgi:hypothetical protein